jgi:hypothetical protein
MVRCTWLARSLSVIETKLVRLTVAMHTDANDTDLSQDITSYQVPIYEGPASHGVITRLRGRSGFAR